MNFKNVFLGMTNGQVQWAAQPIHCNAHLGIVRLTVAILTDPVDSGNYGEITIIET